MWVDAIIFKLVLIALRDSIEVLFLLLADLSLLEETLLSTVA